jgi:hypothetical protein
VAVPWPAARPGVGAGNFKTHSSRDQKKRKAPMLVPLPLAAPSLAFDNFDDVVEPIEVALFVGALVVSAIVLLVTAGVGVRATRAARAGNAVAGLACVVYAGVVHFGERSDWVHFSVLMVPIVLFINLMRSRRATGDPVGAVSGRQE